MARKTTCSRLQGRMGEYLSGRAADAVSQEFRAHLRACSGCSDVRDLVLELRALAARLDESVESALPALREGVLRAAGDASRRLAARPLLSRAWIIPSGAVAATLLLVTFVVTSRDRGTGADPSEEPFRVVLEDQSLVIHWPENGDRLHTVYRSTSPADFSRAKVAVVRGDRWVDSDPQAPGTVFYYRVD